jgi:hypothetical protein
LILFFFVLSDGFTGFVLKQSEIMSVIFYVWWTFLEEKLGGRKIEDGVLKFLQDFLPGDPKRC